MSMQPVIRSNCLYIYGLPTSVTNTDITQFFSDTSVLPDKIHIMLSKYGRPTGESYCEFGTAQQALVALAKDQFYMGPNIVYIQPISRSDMIQAITKPMQQHNHHQDISWNGGMRGTGGGMPRPQQHNNMMQPSVRHHHQGPSYGGGRPYMNNSSGGRGGGNYTPRIRGPGPGPNTGPDGFGQPGCVVALDNVPYRADVQEIVDFFDGFELNSQNVIRRFNDFGKPTGEARVNLRNPQEAMRAVNVLQNMTIYNRPVRLTLL
jgi:RNA recognition motif-containing protein